MSSGNSLSPGDDYFNDLSQCLPSVEHPSSGSPGEPAPEHSQLSGGDGLDGGLPRPKRIACVVCRKRKLRCDGGRPSCGTCARLGHDCAYEQIRRKSGPKRGYVKALEARLAQVETMLKTQDPHETVMTEGLVDEMGPEEPDRRRPSDSPPDSAPAGVGARETMAHAPERSRPAPIQPPLDPLSLENVLGGSDHFTWEMISMGIDEPLPPQDVTDDLLQIYFEKVHPSSPIIHRRRFLAAMNLAPHVRPPVCLRYAMWCLAASITDRYAGLSEIFYRRARKYLELDEMKGHGESMLTIAHCQCWSLICTYEFKSMYFPKAWMSSGRATRMAQMMGLHRLDGVGLDVKQCLVPPRDWTEREERRRTFWLAFCNDRYASIGTGWPMLIDEKDILSNLPATEDAFEMSMQQRTLALRDAMSANGALSLSPFGGVVLMASLFGRNLLHLHRPSDDDREDDLNGEFWRRHRQLDNILLNTSLSMPTQFRLPNGLADANIIFLNMNIHTSTICLHQAAIFKADTNKLPPHVSAESRVRCITAASQIASIMRMISHQDPSVMHPFMSFCLYVSARVFLQYLKTRPQDDQITASLRFLLSAMQVLKRKNPLTESFLVQLEVDLEGSGLDDPAKNSSFAYSLKKGVAEINVDLDPSHYGGTTHPQRPASAAPGYMAGSYAPMKSFGGDGVNPEIHGCRAAPSNTTFDLPSRQKPVRTLFQFQGTHKPLPGVFPSQSLGDMSISSADASLSPEASTTGSSDKPQHPSPNTAHTSPNHPSFTPPSYDDHKHASPHDATTAYYSATTTTTSQADFAGPPLSTTTSSTSSSSNNNNNTFVPPQQPSSFMASPPSAKDPDDPFVLPTGWGYDDGMGLTSSHVSGMFTHMMDVTWDEAQFSTDIPDLNLS